MIAKFCLIALLLSAVAVAQFEDKISIDEFTEEQGAFVIVTSDTVDGGVFTESITSMTSDIIGAERDINFTIENVSQPNQVFSFAITGGEFTEATPPVNQDGVLGFVDAQWDGADNDQLTLNPSGLGGIDLTSNFGERFHIRGRADFDFDVELRVYSGSSSSFCSAEFTVPSGTENTDIFLPYDDFDAISGGCDFQDVGAIQLLVEITTNLDLNLEFLRTNGPVPPTPTPTPTRTASATLIPSAPPTVTPSASFSRSATPSRSISPTPSPIIEDDECTCVCPAFRCELFRSDDEDGGIVGYRSISDPDWYWQGFPSSLRYFFTSWYA